MNEHSVVGGKDYSSFSIKEVKAVVKEIIRTSQSDDEVCLRMHEELNYAGFYPIICSQRLDSVFFSVMIMFEGPDGRIITMR